MNSSEMISGLVGDFLDRDHINEKMIPPTHLDTPISTKDQELATGTSPPNRSLRGSRMLQYELKLLMETSKLSEPLLDWDNTSILKELLRAEMINHATYSDSKTQSFIQGGATNASIQKHAFLTRSYDNKGLNFSDLPPHHRAKILSKSRVRDFWEGLVRVTGVEDENKKTELKSFPYYNMTDQFVCVGSTNNKIKVYTYKRLLIVEYKNETKLLNRDQLLMISDLASQRYILTLAAAYSEHLKATTTLSVDELENVFDWGDNYLKDKTSEAYSIIYKWEALCVSVLISQDPHPLGDFQKDLIEETCGDNVEKADLMKQGVKMLVTFYQTNMHKVSQAYGMYRIWGHPIINPMLGAIALQQVAKCYRAGDPKIRSTIVGKFAEILIHRYWKAHAKWPNMNTSKLGHFHPISLAYANKVPPPRLAREHLAHWSLIKFEKTFNIDTKFEALEMLADKSMSLPLNELIVSITKDHNIGYSDARSVLVKWLESNLSDPIQFLSDISNNGFPKFETVIGTCPKEREGKVKARMFSLLTLYKRMYVVITEALISAHILPLFHEVTMTEDALTLTKRQIQFTRGSSKNSIRSHTLCRYSSLDFVKWNSNMREYDTLPMFKMIDNLFGLDNCIARTHSMFTESYLYLADSYYLPPVDRFGNMCEDPGIWTGHLGGMEGLRQKGWTVWTVCLLLLVAEKITGKLELMGQGDNQVIKITYDEKLNPGEINRLHKTFLLNLESILQKIGPPLKLEETWTSSDTYIYGKLIIHQGVPLSMSFKKVARMFHLSNDLYPTLESSLSSLSANCIASCSSDVSPLIPFLIYSSEVLSSIYHNLNSVYIHEVSMVDHLKKFGSSYRIPLHSTNMAPHSKTSERISPSPEIDNVIKEHVSSFSSDFQLRVLLCPRSLGGMSVLLLPNLLIRRFPDPTVFAIASLKEIYLHTQRVSVKNIIKTILSPVLSSSRNYELLLENPTSLNLATPSSPSEGKRDLLLRYFNKEVENPKTWIKHEAFKYFMTQSQTDQKEFAQYLLKFSPRFPRILSEIWAATPLARARNAMGKIGKAKTLLRRAAKAGFPLLDKIRKSEKNHTLASFMMMYHKSERNMWNDQLCSVEWVDHLRNQGWGYRLEGLTAVPPMECFRIETLGYLEECDEHHYISISPNSIRVKMDPSLNQNLLKSSQKIGGYTPYIGSSTRETTTGYGKTLAKVCPPIAKKPLGLTNLIGWATERDSELTKLINHLVSVVTDLDPRGLEPDQSQISGTIHHRINDLRTDHGGGISLLYTHFTKIQFSSSELSEYSKGSSNTNLMFQAIFIYYGSLISTELESGETLIPPSYHIHLKSKCCIQEVNESQINGPPADLQRLIPAPEFKNEFNWCPKESILESSDLHTWSDKPTVTSDSLQSVENLVSIVSEASMKIVRTHYLRDPGGSTPMIGKMPFNWAIRTPPIELLYHLSIRLLSMFLSCIMTGEIKYKDMLTGIMGFIKDISDSGFTHLDTLLNNENLLDQLIWMNLIDHGVADPSLPRQAIGHHFHCVINNMLIKSCFEKCVLPQLQYISTISCPLDQVPTLLGITHILCIAEVDQKEALIRIYRKIRKMFADLREGSGPPRNIDMEVHLAFKHEFGEDTPNFYLHILNNIVLGHHNLSPDSYCKLFPTNRIPAQENCVEDNDQAPKREFAFEINKVHEGAALTLTVPLGLDNRATELVSSSRRLIEADRTAKDFSKWEFKVSQLPSSSCYKLASVMRSCLDILPGEINTVATLADGAGGFSYLFGVLDSSCTIIYNTLKIPNDDMEQNPMKSYIPALVAHPDIKKRTIGLDLLEEGISNLLDFRFEQQLRNSFLGSIDLITCDAEAVSRESKVQSQLLHNIMRIAAYYACPVVIYKTYYLDLPYLCESIKIAGVYYNGIRLSRSALSSSTNTEIYLIAFDLKTHHLSSLLPHGPGLIWALDVDDDELLKFCSRAVQFFDYFDVDDDLLGKVAQSINSLLERGTRRKLNLSLTSTISVLKSLNFKSWQMALMSWISRSINTPEQKVINNYIRCSVKTLARISVQWLIAYSFYCDLPSYKIQDLMLNGKLVLYRTIVPNRIGSLLLDPNLPLNVAKFNKCDRLIVLRTILTNAEMAYIFKEIGLMRAMYPDEEEERQHNLRTLEDDNLLAGSWWPKHLGTASSLYEHYNRGKSLNLTKLKKEISLDREGRLLVDDYYKELAFSSYNVQKV